MPLRTLQPSYLALWYQHVLVMRCEDMQLAVVSLCPLCLGYLKLPEPSQHGFIYFFQYIAVLRHCL